MAATTYVLTGSPENFEATRAHGFDVIGMKEGRRRLAEGIEVGDRLVFYLTREQAFAAIARVTGEMYEDRTPIWPGKPGKADPYPWRFAIEPELVLPDDAHLPAEGLVGQMEHIGKWPAEHWHLAFQGQLRPVSEADAHLLERLMRERAESRPAAA